MKNIIYSLFLIVFFCGCSIKLTQDGTMVRTISEKERDNCKFLGIVTGSMSMGTTTSDDAESAMNEVRNKASELGANAIRILNIDSDLFSSTVTAEALKCDFKN